MRQFLEFLSQERRILQQRREIQALQLELDKLRSQNESMRQGMRRCISCEYRLEVIGSRDEGHGGSH